MKKSTKHTVPVSERAVVQRINRKFVSEDGPALPRQLKKTRGRAKSVIGDFFILDEGNVTSRHIDPESLARELGVLAEWEHIMADTSAEPTKGGK